MKPLVIALCVAAAVSGCASNAPFLPRSGPSSDQMISPVSGIELVSLDLQESKKLAAHAHQSKRTFTALKAPAGFSEAIAVGEQVQLTLMEAAPAMLLAGGADGLGGARSLQLPDQIVQADGSINVPFVGRVKVAGKAPQEVEKLVADSLKGKANTPQAMVRINAVAQEVTVVGEVRAAKRQALSQKRERLLDVIAAAGGSSAPVEKVSVSVSRADTTIDVPLQRVIREPQENIQMSAGDVVTVYHQPQHFVALGAVSKQGEVPYEATGISLAQAVARAGGLIDSKAAASDVFLARQGDGKATVYRLEMTRPDALFVMRNTPVNNGDIVYVANAQGAELQKFLLLVGSLVSPVASINAMGN
jgi:polysaccharide export outer membrane protein